jgi:hypothetical protein
MTTNWHSTAGNLKVLRNNIQTGKQELLSIVETLKEFKSELLGQKLIVHTDHKNL